LRSVLSGVHYPDGLYEAVIRRIHADQEINYVRACIIKGWLIRNRKKEVRMSLDTGKKDPAYRIGRLFATLEKTQADALGNIGSTIRDRFYSAASATPQSVFPRLLRMYQHHLAKLEGGLKVSREKLLQEIVEPLAGFPAHLNLADQGMFALGYYHQMQAFYRRKSDDACEKSED
jgi:CRISPR-associated protein Csd1